MRPAPVGTIAFRPRNSMTWLASLLLFGLFATGVWATSWVGVGRSMKEDTRSVAFGALNDNLTIHAFSGHKHYGVFKAVSTDNGQTWGSWQPTPLNEYQIFSLATGAAASVNVVVTHPDYKTTPLVLAGTDSGKVFRSTNHGTTWVAATGLPASTQIMDIAFANGGIVACTWGNGVYRSADGGATFSAMPTIFGSTSRVMKADPLPKSTTEFFVVTASNGINSGGVYRWNGTEWTNLSGSLPGWGTTTYSFSSVRAVDPPEPVGPEIPNPKLWVGDMNGNGLLVSNDLGATWSHTCLTCEIVTWLSAAPDYDAANEHMLVGTSWGWYEHILGGTGSPCQRRFPKGLAVNSITADPNWSPGKPILWLGTSDGIRYLAPGGFPSPPSGDEELSSFDISFLQSSPSVETDGALYAASKQFGIFRSLDRGTSFHQYMPSLGVASTGTNFSTPITAIATYPTFSGGSCNSNGATIFMATDGAGAFRSTAAGSDWAPIVNGLVSQDQRLCFLVHTPVPTTVPLYAGACSQNKVFKFSASTSQWSLTQTNPPGTKITALALPPNYNGLTVLCVFAGTDQGLFHSPDGGASWNPELVPGTGPITAIAFSPAYNGGDDQNMFATRGGSGVYRHWDIDPGAGFNWQWQPVAGINDSNLTALAVSPNFPSDQGVAAATGNPNSEGAGGVFISTDSGATWTLRGSGMSDRQVRSLAVVKRPGGLRLVAGVQRNRAYYMDDPFVASPPNWVKSTGFETSVGEIRATAMSPALTNIGCTQNTPNEEGSDVFIGGTNGVFWSNDGGETYRPINQWWDKTDWTCPLTVNALFAFINPVGPGGGGTPTPMLLAGTQGRGVWYRYAVVDSSTGAWDWTQGQWVESDLASGTVNAFTRERNFNPLVIRAATDSGSYVSKAPSIFGEQWVGSGLAGNVTDIANSQVPVVGLKIPNQPDAPSGNASWGTVSNSGVWKGVEGGYFSKGYAPSAVTWTEANGSGAGFLENMNTRSVVQLSDYTLLCGTNAAGVYRSEDEGVNWWEAAATTLGGLGKPVTDFLEATNGDVLCAVDSSSTGGGVFLSGDKGRHWASISEGFDSSSQSLSSIVASTDTPPAYYAGTYTHGSYATTITAENYPTVTGLSTGSGTATGGTAVTVYGTNFSNTCPANYTCPDSAPVVVFGGVDAAATWVSATQLTVTTPAHPGGAATVWVRNPDTRAGQYAGTFSFTEVEGGSPEFKVTITRDITNRVVVTWVNAPGAGATRIFRSPTVDFSRRVTTVTVSGTSGSYTFTDTTGTDGYKYYYKVE